MKNILKLSLFLAFAVISTGAAPQSITVSGIVTDEEKRPLIGVSVIEKDTQNAAVTGIDGRYTLTVPKGAKLIFTSLGYQTQEHKVKNGKLDVVMKTDVVDQAEEIVIGYGTANVADAMKGQVSGLKIVQAEISSSYLLYDYDAMDAEEYSSFSENRFNSVARSPLSTFSLDVDGASYSNARRMINSGELPPRDAVRVEEFVNYFDYGYPQPTGNDPVKITCEVGACPWNAAHRLVSIGVKAKEIPTKNLPKSNFVFLIDVSGSMYGRLDMVKSSMKLLVNNLRDEDRVAIVVYAGAAGIKLESTPGSDRQKIREALDGLTAGGSTAGGAGIKLAYGVARKNFIEGGNNRVGA